jgi:hypothetical protein
MMWLTKRRNKDNDDNENVDVKKDGKGEKS